jgi:ubiquinone/menaquinone biosynthesis C-methylase UbiE
VEGILDKQAQAWMVETEKQLESGGYPKWPNEVMLKLIFGDYLKKPINPNPNWRVLDVGCHFANNLLPFHDLGCELYGVDIHPNMVTIASKVATTRGLNAEFKVGSNRNLPYPDKFLDLVISISTIHYESCERDVHRAFSEFRRVLKPGGILYISSVAPEHFVQVRAKSVADHIYRVSNFDFRTGEQFFFFDTEDYFKRQLSHYFDTVETGRVTERLMESPLDFFVAVCS